MTDKVNIQEIIRALAQKNGMGDQEAEAFVSKVFLLIEQGLEKDGTVKLTGLGIFKLVKSAPSHSKVTFLPEAGLRKLFNEPFDLFETVILDDPPQSPHAPIIAQQPMSTGIPPVADIPEPPSATAENADKQSSKNKKSPAVYMAIGAAATILCAAILYFLVPTHTGAPQETVTIDTTPLPADTVPLSQPPTAEDLWILNNTDPVRPDSVNYIITGTRTTYSIKQGETLTKVALRFYGTKDLWPYILKHNSETIKNPRTLSPGTLLAIPELQRKEE
jgi:nucleoid DNA-binding protein